MEENESLLRRGRAHDVGGSQKTAFRYLFSLIRQENYWSSNLPYPSIEAVLMKLATKRFLDYMFEQNF